MLVAEFEISNVGLELSAKNHAFNYVEPLAPRPRPAPAGCGGGGVNAMKDEPFSFQWESSENPSDPSGIARFKVDMESVAIPMNDFRLAVKLDRLIKKACERKRDMAIDCTIAEVSRALIRSKYGHD